MWDNDGLRLISSYLGKPLLADEYTINQNRLAYTSVCIEIDLDFAYPGSIPLLIDGKFSFELPVEHQWKPPKCDACRVFGHSTKSCGKKKKTKWTPKKVYKPSDSGDSGEIEKTISSENDKNETSDDDNDGIESGEALPNGGSEDIDAGVRKMLHPMVCW